MSILVWLVALLATAYSAYQIGRRVEIGRREQQLAEWEEVAEARGQRPGTVRLSTMKIRR